MGFVEKLKDFVGLSPNEYDDEFSYDTSMPTEDYTSHAGHTNTVDLDDQTATEPNFSRSGNRHYAAQFRQDATPPMNTLDNVIGMPRAFTETPEVMILEPRSFEEMPQAIQALRDRKTVVLNLSLMDLEQAQRAVDFVAGGTFAIDGHQERVGESIFLFTPNCVKVSSQNGVTHEAPQVHTRAPGRPSGPMPQWGHEDVTMIA